MWDRHVQRHHHFLLLRSACWGDHAYERCLLIEILYGWSWSKAHETDTWTDTTTSYFSGQHSVEIIQMGDGNWQYWPKAKKKCNGRFCHFLVIAKDLANITRTYFTEILNSMETTFVDVSTLWRSRTWGMVRPHLWPRLELWNHINCLFYIPIDWGFERNLKSAKKCLHFRRSEKYIRAVTEKLVKPLSKALSRSFPEKIQHVWSFSGSAHLSPFLLRQQHPGLSLLKYWFVHNVQSWGAPKSSWSIDLKTFWDIEIQIRIRFKIHLILYGHNPKRSIWLPSFIVLHYNRGLVFDDIERS